MSARRAGRPDGAGTDTRRPRPRGRKRGILLLLIAALVAGGGVAANQLTPSRMLDAPAAREIPAADAGTAYCPIVATEGETAQLEIASASAEEDSEVLLTRYVDGQAVPQDPVGIAAGQSLVLDIPAEEAGAPISLDWRGAPVVAQYRLDAPTDVVGSGDQAVATCQTQPSDRWYLAGFDTNRGSTSTLHLFNPFNQDAVVSLQFGTAEGPVDLVIADEIQVPAGSVVVQDLAELRPETADLAVSVRAQVGRVVTQGHVVRGPAGEGLEAITGRALLPAVAVPSSELHLPEARSDEVTESWVTIYNPSDRAAAVQVQVSTPLGDAGRLASELTVPAGGVARVDLADLSALPRMGVVLRSVNGIGLIATRGSAVQDGARTGVSLAVATAATDTRWTVVGGGEDAELVLFNPGEVIATATVTIGGSALAEDLEVPPNGLAALPLADVESGGAALVQSDEPLVAGVVNLSATEATAFWSAVGTSDARLRGASEAISAQREPSLSSAPVVSATATPTPLPEAAVPGGEGELDPTITPTTVPTPTVTPTPSPDATPLPTPPPATVAPAPTPGAPDATAPDPGATAPAGEAPGEPAPGDGEIPESEGSLFG